MKYYSLCVPLSLMAVAFFLSLSLPAHAYLSTIDTGEIISSGHYRVFFETQQANGPTNSSGVNAIAKFDIGISQSSNLRFHLGAGGVNFDTGVDFKWIPFPDFKEQPAIGLRAGLGYASTDKRNFTNITAGPIVSKMFDVNFGKVVPYASIPVTASINGDTTTTLANIAVGSEFKFEEAKSLSVFVEFGGNVTNSFNYLSVAFAISWDDIKALRDELK